MTWAESAAQARRRAALSTEYRQNSCNQKETIFENGAGCTNCNSPAPREPLQCCFYEKDGLEYQPALLVDKVKRCGLPLRTGDGAVQQQRPPPHFYNRNNGGSGEKRTTRTPGEISSRSCDLPAVYSCCGSMKWAIVHEIYSLNK